MLKGPIAITGASGFLGRAVSAALQESGLSIIEIGRSVSGPGKISTYSSVEELSARLAGSTAVLHFADQADRRAYEAEQLEKSAENMRALCSAMAEQGVARLIAVSSTYAQERARSLYGQSKWHMEQAALNARAIGISPIILRLPPVYGKGSSGMLAKLAHLVQAGVPLPLSLARKPRQFLSVENLNSLILALLTADSAGWETNSGQAYLPTDPEPMGLGAIARCMAWSCGRPAILWPLPMIDKVIDRQQPSNVEVTGSLRDDFGWEAEYRPPATFNHLRD